MGDQLPQKGCRISVGPTLSRIMVKGITPRLTHLFAFPKIKECWTIEPKSKPRCMRQKMLYRHITRGRTFLKLPRILVERRKYLKSGQVRHMGSNRIVNFDKRFLYQLHHAKRCYRFGHRCNAEKTATAHFHRSSHIGPTKGRIINDLFLCGNKRHGSWNAFGLQRLV